MPGVRAFNGGRQQEEWGTYELPKEGLIDSLRRQLVNFPPSKARVTDWGNGWILMSFLTDPYSPSPGKRQITRQCLEMLFAAGHKVRIQTRSALVEQDFDLLEAHRDRVLLGTSLPHLDDSLARVLEPKASPPSRRLKMLQKAADRGIPLYVAVAPVLPFHDTAELDRVVAAVAPLRPREIFCEVLNPKGSNIEMVAKALEPTLPARAKQIRDYSPQVWAAFTCQILRHGFLNHFDKGFTPWPDSSRQWKKYLTAAECSFLNQHLPAETPRKKRAVATA